MIKTKGRHKAAFCFLCDPGEDRTHDPKIKSLLLYQLSYEVILGLQRCEKMR